jgi:hypothetical protein
VTDRLVALDRLGRGDDVEAVLLNRPLDFGIHGVERSVISGPRGGSDPPPFGRADRGTPLRDDAA